MITPKTARNADEEARGREVAEQEVADGGDERQKGQLHRVVGALEREEPHQASAGGAGRWTRGAATSAFSSSRGMLLYARDTWTMSLSALL